MTNHEEWYAKMNREMTVPTLKYNDEILTETAQIVDFLNHNHPEKELMPDDQNRAKVEAYVNDVFSSFGAISKYTSGILHKQRLFGLYEQTHPKTMKIKQLRRNPEMRQAAEAKIAQLQKKNAQLKAMSSTEAEA